MDYPEQIFGSGEKAMFRLRDLYSRYGYEQYRVSRFEEYDLYAQNRSFLTGKHILTFTDTNGHLMALKPDITLSIIKNTVIGTPYMRKVYYSENVYRDGSSGFREIPQTGLECIGELDLYSISEVILLASKSLEAISSEYILDISHIGIIAELLEIMALSPADESELLRFVAAKNAHEATALCRARGVSEALITKLEALIRLYAPLETAISEIEKLDIGPKTNTSVKELANVSSIIGQCGASDKIFFDFSLLSDTNYYNGIIFRGFIEGIPSGILSGGQYDGLMKKMGKDTGAIGFALYLDLLEHFGAPQTDYDADVLLLYGDETDAADVLGAVNRLASEGKTVRADKNIPKGSRYGEIVRMGKGGAE